jgi:hypothetical protein
VSITKSSRNTAAALAATIKYCVAALIVCILLIGIMRARRSAAEHRNDLAAQHIRIARANVDRANERRALTEKYLAPYNRLVREGSMQRFDRAAAGDWFETAVRGPEDGAVDGYMIGKDVPYLGEENAALTAFRIISHPLEFTAKVDDEDEFVDLMKSIETRLPGTSAAEACSLSRDRESGLRMAPLAVRCNVIWYEFARADAALSANAQEPKP